MFFKDEKVILSHPFDDGNKEYKILDNTWGIGLASFHPKKHYVKCFYVGQDDHPAGSTYAVVCIRQQDGEDQEWRTVKTSIPIEEWSRMGACLETSSGKVYCCTQSFNGSIHEFVSSKWDKTAVLYKVDA